MIVKFATLDGAYEVKTDAKNISLVTQHGVTKGGPGRPPVKVLRFYAYLGSHSFEVSRETHDRISREQDAV